MHVSLLLFGQISILLLVKLSIDFVDLYLPLVDVFEFDSDSENSSLDLLVNLNDLEWVGNQFSILRDLISDDHLARFEDVGGVGVSHKGLKVISCFELDLGWLSFLLIGVKKVALHLQEVNVLAHCEVEVLLVCVCSVDRHVGP
jgi:hypothetical protein